MSRAPIRVGVVGCGEIAQLMHLPVLHELAEFEIAGLCDLSADTVTHLAGRYGVELAVTDYCELLSSGALDAVVVCTYDHAPVAEAALASGLHVLVEKPLAFTAEEAWRLARLAADTEQVAMVGYMKLFDPALAGARREIERVGRTHSVTCHDFAGSFAGYGQLYTQFRSDDVPAETLAAGRDQVGARIREMLGPEHAGYEQLYTLLLMLGSHDLSVMRGLFGIPERVVYARPRGDDGLLAVLEYADGFPCVMEIGVGTSYERWDEWVAVHGSDATLRLEFPNPYVRYAPSILRIGESVDGSACERVVAVSHQDLFRLEWQQFAACVNDGSEVISPLSGGADDLELAAAIITAMPPRPTVA